MSRNKNKGDDRVFDEGPLNAPPSPEPSVPPETPVPPDPPKVAKKITCPRCQGDGVWHTSATGRRLATIGGSVVDSSKPCPNCKGKKKVVIWITAEQAESEKAEREARIRMAKARVDTEARAAKRKIDAE